MLTNCGVPATAMCIYCGRSFCGRHGVVLPDGGEVCNRKPCVAKKDDLAVHLRYKAAVYDRNMQQLCGLDVCTQEIQVRCNRCKGYFCLSHTAPWVETITDLPERTCQHCFERRPIWTRE